MKYAHSEIYDPVSMFRCVSDREVPRWLNLSQATPGIVLNLGAGEKHIEGAISLDLPEWDADLMDIPYQNGSVKTIYAIHFFEHLKNPLETLRECQRVLMPGGLLNIGLPHARSDSQYNDLDHKSAWGEDSFKTTFANPYYGKGHDGWQFDIGANLIMGVAYRNLMLVTQLVRR